MAHLDIVSDLQARSVYQQCFFFLFIIIPRLTLIRNYSSHSELHFTFLYIYIYPLAACASLPCFIFFSLRSLEPEGPASLTVACGTGFTYISFAELKEISKVLGVAF